MVDAIVTVLTEKLVEALADQGRLVFELRNQFEKLKTELQLMQSFLTDADRLKRKHQTLRTIMASLRELVYEAQDILGDCEIRSMNEEQFVPGCSMCSYPSLSNLPFYNQAGKRLKDINQKITSIKQNMAAYLSTYLLSQQMSTGESHNNDMSRSGSHLFDHTQVVGLEGDTEKVRQWLFTENQGLLAIGIVGMGGLGKTTAAQKVFNDTQVETHFEKRMWVLVSQTFTVEQIMRSMLKNLGDASVSDDRNGLLEKINQYLQGKRYLIVMDDVWSEDTSWWNCISEGLPKGNGSRIIITTRIKKVARKMGVTKERTHKPNFLNIENSWLLFRKIAFAETSGECINPELVEVGKEIVQKCKGLPLAIKAIGGIMLCKSPYLSEWRRITDGFLEELTENDDSVKASLQLSYDELPSHLKSCFLCFSLYPEDSVITVDQLINWWIGEGFIPSRSGKSATEIGKDCFSGLMNRCLIEAVDKTYDGKIITCKIHDMVRDLVINLAKEDAFSTSDGLKSRRLGLKSGMDQSCFQNNLKVRALLSTPITGETNKVATNIGKKFCDCRYLRVLDLSKSIFETHLSSLLDHIGLLQHLTYICLSNTHPLIRLPHSMEKLKNLKILDLSYCQNLKTLPSCITQLRNLIVLDVSHCGSLEYLPKGLGRLSNLQALLGFKPARPHQFKGCRLSELNLMTQLGSLELRLTRDDEIGDDEVDVLAKLKKLKFFIISCFDSHGTGLVKKIDKLFPPPQILELCLKFFPGNMSPAWISPVSLPMLQSLSISSGNLVKMNPLFWGRGQNVWKVEAMMLEALSDLDEKWASFQIAMPLLRFMSISWCPNLESFPIEDVGFRGGVWKKEQPRWQRSPETQIYHTRI